MTNSQRQSKARHSFLHWIGENQGSLKNSETDIPTESSTIILREGMVIREDFFLGRRFVTERCDAIWFIEEDQLKIFDASGAVLKVINHDEINQRAEKYEKLQGLADSGHTSAEQTEVKLHQPSPQTDSDQGNQRKAA